MASAEYMRKWRAENKDRQREIYKTYRNKNREKYRERIKGYNAKWRAANPERWKEITQRFRDKHHERLGQERRERYYADVDKTRAYFSGKMAERRAWLVGIKMQSGCVDCGFKVHPDALQFDHLPGHEKSFNIGSGVCSRSKKSLIAEIAKTEVVCANCHAIRTAMRRLNG